MLNKELLSAKEKECSALQKCFLRKTTTQQTKKAQPVIKDTTLHVCARIFYLSSMG